MSLTIPSPLAVERNRNTRLSAPQIERARIYTTQTGDAPRGPSRREREEAAEAQREIACLTERFDNERDCCLECWNPKIADRVATLHALIERNS